MADYIPDHILGDILVRLPFVSLIRSRCVSKSWRNLIDSSYITRMHSTRSRLVQTYPHPDSKIIARIGDQIYAFDRVVNKGKGLCKANAKQLSSPATEFPDQFFVILGCCNGIFCLGLMIGEEMVYDRDLVLWNPFTCSYFELPSPPDDFSNDVHMTVPAFGYDHMNDDYKVVRWFVKNGFSRDNDKISPRRHELCVYSLKQKSWRAIRDGISFELPEHKGPYFLGDNCVMANGSAHWYNYDSLIVVMDLGNYEFRKISFGPSPIGWKKLRCLNGCLSLVCYPGFHYHYSSETNTPAVADIWVMEEYGVETSWKKIASIGLLEEGREIKEPMPVAMLQKGKKLLLRALSGKLVIYDTERKSVCKVAVKNETDWSEICVCEEDGKDSCSGDCYYYSDYWVSVASSVSPDSCS